MLNWARGTSWGLWDEWDDTALQTQDSKFKPWRSEVEHATFRFVSFKPPRPENEPRTLAWNAAVLTTTLGPPHDVSLPTQFPLNGGPDSQPIAGLMPVNCVRRYRDTSRSRRLPTMLSFTSGWGRNMVCFFQTAETGKRTPNSGVQGSGANHYAHTTLACNWDIDGDT